MSELVVEVLAEEGFLAKSTTGRPVAEVARLPTRSATAGRWHFESDW